MNLHHQIRQRRKALGIKLKDFAETINISPSYLSQIEQGKQQTSIEILIKICKHLRLRIMLQPIKLSVKMHSFTKEKAVFWLEIPEEETDEEINVMSNWEIIETIPAEEEWRDRRYSECATRAIKESGHDTQHYYHSNFPFDGDLEWHSTTAVPIIIFAPNRAKAQKEYDYYGITDFFLKE